MIVTYALLTLALLALWVGGSETRPDERQPPLRRLWMAFLAAAVAAGLLAGILRPVALLWIAGFAAAVLLFARADANGPQRLGATIALLGLAAGLMAHQLPGFNNPLVIPPTRFSPDALPFRLHLNFDKPLIGLFIIGLLHRRLAHIAQWRAMAAAAAPVTAGLIVAIVVLSVAAGYVRFDPKLPGEAWLWLWVNLCFTCVGEEALFRGFIQAQLQRAWREVPRGEWLALGTAAVLFGVAHAAGGIAYVALATLAGIGYGWVFLRTGRIEASILTHFALNTVHFLGFTYPALDR